MKKILGIVVTLTAFVIGVVAFEDLFSSGIAGSSFALIAAGYTKVCDARSGGVKNIWIASRVNISSTGFTLTSGEYSAVTMESGKVFYKFEFDQDSAEHRWSTSMEGLSASTDNQVEFYLGKLSTNLRARLQDITDSSPCGMVVIVEDNNSVKWVYGYTENHKCHITEDGRPMRLLTAEAASGKAFTDPNGATVTLQAINNQAPLVFNGNVPV